MPNLYKMIVDKSTTGQTCEGKGHPIKNYEYVIECTVRDGVSSLYYDDFKDDFSCSWTEGEAGGYSCTMTMSRCKRIVIPDSVRFIDSELFYRMQSCVFEISPDNPAYEVVDHILFSKNKKKIIAVLGKTEFKEEYRIPDSVERIEKYAFYNTNFESIICGENLSYIAEEAFSYSSIHSISFNAGLKYIGSKAFYSCRNLENYQVPPEATVAADAFAETKADNNKIFVIHGNVLFNWNWIYFRECLAQKEIVIPYGVEKIRFFAFHCTYPNIAKAETIYFPETVKYIDEEAFEGFRNLRRLVFYGKIPRIIHNTFLRSGEPEEIVINPKLQTIEEVQSAQIWLFRNAKISYIEKLEGNISS